MAVCRTIRSRAGVTKFLLQSENGDEYVTAFKYKDGKVEIHSLRTECTPLYLEENTSVNLISNDSFSTSLVAITPQMSANSLEFRLWDIANGHGFTPKEVSVTLDDGDKMEEEISYNFDIKNLLNEDLNNHISTSYGSFLSVILNGKCCILFKARRSVSGLIYFQLKTSFTHSDNSFVNDAVFLKTEQKLYLLLAEGSNVNILYVNDESNEITSCNILSLPIKKSQSTSIAKLHRITCSKCLVIDNVGHISLLSAPSELTSLKFPSSVGGHGILAVVGFKHTSEGILVICNNDYTVNFYSLADILCSVVNGCSVYVKPYRVFCSQFPINAVTFVRSDQVAMASAVNQSITFLGGLLSNSPH